jgi:hypothetical protein
MSEPLQVFVLGMHRSGTSLVASLLRLLGVFLGDEDDFIPADQDNPQGFWERRGVISLNNLVLRAGDAAWDRVASFDAARIRGRFRRRFAEGAAPLVRTLDARGTWAIKDPRLCLTLPLWRPLCPHAACVVALRHPIEVASSLERRDRIPLATGVALWERYTRSALLASDGLPRTALLFDDLFAGPEETAGRLRAFLAARRDIELRPVSDEAVRGHVNPAERHHRVADELSDMGCLLEPQRALWRILSTGVLPPAAEISRMTPEALDLLRGYEREALRRLPWRRRLRILRRRVLNRLPL